MANIVDDVNADELAQEIQAGIMQIREGLELLTNCADAFVDPLVANSLGIALMQADSSVDSFLAQVSDAGLALY